MSAQTRPWIWEEDGYTVTRSTAWSGPGCHEGCGVLIYTKGGRVVKVEGDPENPYNQGRLCPRCLTVRDVIYHPDRLKYPMKRVGERGEGKWERISWEEAYDTIEKNFKEIIKKVGPESIIGFRGTGRDLMFQEDRLMYSIGTPNIVPALSGISCFVPRAATYVATLGAYSVPDCSQFFADRYDNPTWRTPEVIIVWGTNPIYSNPDSFYGAWIVECMKRGTKLIVVDPRLTWLASRAKVWLQIRPGTDGALAIGMVDILIKEALYDREFVDQWTFGFDKLSERVAEYPVDKVSEITWIPEEKILAATRLYGKSKPAAIHLGLAVDMQITGVQAAQAIISMMAITGNIDVPGGNALAVPPFGVETAFGGWGRELLTEEQKDKLIGSREYPLMKYGMPLASPDKTLEQMETGEPYPIKGAWIQGTNILACMSQDPKRWYTAFKKLEFVAAVDLFMNPTIMAFADIVLPAATYPEKVSLRAMLYNLSTLNRAVEYVEDCKSDLLINLELGKRFNPEAWPWETEEQALDGLLKPSGMTFKQLQDHGPAYPEYPYKKYEKGLLRRDGQTGFNTPTGKVELYSTFMEKLGLSPLPYYQDPMKSPVSTPEVYKEYPIILMTGARSPAFFHSEHRQIRNLREIHPDPVVEIHPDTAAQLGIIGGDWVWIENEKDRIRQKAKITPIIHPKMALVNHGWWFPEKPGPEPSLFGYWDVNTNRLLDMGNVGETGFGADIKCTLCKIYKVKEGEM